MANFSDAFNSRFRMSNWFFENPLEHENQTQISRLLKVAIFGIFDCFFLTLKTPWQTVTDGKKSSENEISKEHFDTKKTEFGAKLCNK